MNPRKKEQILTSVKFLSHLNHLIITTLLKLSILGYYQEAKKAVSIALVGLNLVHIVYLAVIYRFANEIHPMEAVLALMRITALSLHFIYSNKPLINIKNNDSIVNQKVKKLNLIITTVYLLIFNVQLWSENKSMEQRANIYRFLIVQLATLSLLFQYFYWGLWNGNNIENTYSMHMPLAIIFINTIIAQPVINFFPSLKINPSFKMCCIASGFISIGIYCIFAAQNQEEISLNPEAILYSYFFIMESIFQISDSKSITRLKNIGMIQIPMVIAFLNIPHNKMIGEHLSSFIANPDKKKKTKMENFLLVLSIISTAIVIWRNEKRYIITLNSILVILQILEAMNIRNSFLDRINNQEKDSAISKAKRVMVAIPLLATFIEYVQEYN
jgi:hypothetical protein